MRAQGPTFWLLKGDLDWREGYTENIVTDGQIRLAVDPSGPLTFASQDGSLGGLRLPQGMALDDTSLLLYLLDRNTQSIKRYEPAAREFLTLPNVGGPGSEARQFQAAGATAIAGGNLYIADRGNRRIQVFALNSLALRHVWGPWDGNRRPVEPDHGTAWEPVDLAAAGDRVAILDHHYGRVFIHQPGKDALTELIEGSEENAGRFSRIALDRDGRIYLLDASSMKLMVFDTEGRYLEEARDPGELLDRFARPAIRLDHKGRFCLPESLARECPRELPSQPASALSPLVGCGSGEAGLLFNRHGDLLEPSPDPEQAGPRLYARQGTWISAALDSRIHACQWHRVELDLHALPPGSKLRVSTYTDHEPRSIQDIVNPTVIPERLWETHHALLGRPVSESAEQEVPVTVCNEGSGTASARQEEMLVQSYPGQYLWLRLQIYGDGYVTPQVEAVRIHYPRDAYLKYLPAVFAAEYESRSFLERFLSLFQTEWDAIETRIENIARYFDPDAVPAGPCLEYLASQWLALPLEGSWNSEQKRRLLAAAPEYYERRGTLEGLRFILRIYLANITGIRELADEGIGQAPGVSAFPVLVEGYRRREFLMLQDEEHSRLNRNHPLWSPAVVGRLQLDVFAREGKVRLVSTGDPERDFFHEHAHRFQVFLPSTWLRSKADEALLQRALDREKPAHTKYELCLVEPRFRVGIQSTVGVDTIIGDYPVAVLAGSTGETDVPVNRPPRQRLGYDTVLGGESFRQGGMPLAGIRVGINTVLS